MKLAEIHVDRYGGWRDLTLSLDRGQVSVLYGPNEAGKSTLVRFIRGVLYGFEAGEMRGAGAGANHAGSLVIEREGHTHRIHRARVAGTSAGASVIDADAARPADGLLAELLRGLDDRAFRSLFAIDLHELEELSALPSEQAAERIYGLSLGPAAQGLLDAQRSAQALRSRLIDPFQQDGELVRLFERQDELAAQLRSLESRRRTHEEKCRQRDRLDDEAVNLRERHSGILQQLRGHRYLERAYEPWRQLWLGRRELAGSALPSEFPEGGVDRLDRIETELAAVAAERDGLLTEARQIRDRLRQTGAKSGLPRAGVLRGWVAQRGWLADLNQRREDRSAQVENAERELSAALEGAGPEWTLERLSSLDLTPEGWQWMSGAAHSWEAAQSRRATHERQFRRQHAEYREMRDALAEALHDVDEGHEGSISTALTDARERLRQVKHLGRLQLREAELQQRQFNLNENRDRIVPQLILPGWVHIVLGLFCFMGIVLAGWGLIAGVATSGIAGAIYALLGITCGGLAWGLKAQYEGDARRRLEDAESKLAETLVELQEVRTSIRGLSGQPEASDEGADPALEIDGGELVRLATERVAELFDLSRQQRVMRQTRRQLRQTRKKVQIVRRELDTARDAWSERLDRLGLPESLPVSEALAAWQRLLEAGESLRRRNHALEEQALLEAVWVSWKEALAASCRRLGWDSNDAGDPLVVLEDWDRQLARMTELRRDLRQGKKQIRARRRDAALRQARVDDLKVQRNALLVQAGAATREEFEQRAAQAARCGLLEAQCAAAQQELDRLAEDHTDLALVEEDLIAFDPVENRRCLETLELEAADLQLDLDRTNENLTALAGEIRDLEDDRGSTGLRCQMQQVRQRLQHAAHEWAVIETAAQVGDALRHHYERRHQPVALQDASRHLARLTGGRYQVVWTPLGERRLMVDDEAGRSLSAADLSRGAREQLFLAVRLALVEELSRQGISLPLILDDVFVNFDEARTDAAADVLLDFARNGRQVLLFTCHLHLARLFQSRGVEPIWLPAREASSEREEQRRAG